MQEMLCEIMFCKYRRKHLTEEQCRARCSDNTPAKERYSSASNSDACRAENWLEKEPT